MKYFFKLSLVFSSLLGLFVARSELLTCANEADIRAAIGIAAQISATMLGFLIAAMSILASISGHRLLRNMQKTGHYQVLLRKLFWNSGAYALAMVVAFSAILLNGEWFYRSAVLSLASFTYASLILIDIGWRFWLVLANLGSMENS